MTLSCLLQNDRNCDLQTGSFMFETGGGGRRDLKEALDAWKSFQFQEDPHLSPMDGQENGVVDGGEVGREPGSGKPKPGLKPGSEAGGCEKFGARPGSRYRWARSVRCGFTLLWLPARRNPCGGIGQNRELAEFELVGRVMLPMQMSRALSIMYMSSSIVFPISYLYGLEIWGFRAHLAHGMVGRLWAANCAESGVEHEFPDC